MLIETDHNLLAKFERRAAHLRRVGFGPFRMAKNQFLLFIEESPILKELIENFESDFPEAKNNLSHYLENSGAEIKTSSEYELAAWAYYFFRDYCNSNTEISQKFTEIYARAFGASDSGPAQERNARMMAVVRDLFLEPLLLYLYEQLDKQ